MAVVVGCFLGLQLWLVWELHTENVQLQSQVTRLSSQVCLYQSVAQTINSRLAAKGYPQITLPHPADCPSP